MTHLQGSAAKITVHSMICKYGLSHVKGLSACVWALQVDRLPVFFKQRDNL